MEVLQLTAVTAWVSVWEVWLKRRNHSGCDEPLLQQTTCYCEASIIDITAVVPFIVLLRSHISGLMAGPI
jgi:hypothetical protein